MSTSYFLRDKRIREIQDFVTNKFNQSDAYFSQRINNMLDSYVFDDYDRKLSQGTYYTGSYNFDELRILCNSGRFEIVDEYDRVIDVDKYIDMVTSQ